MVRKFQINLSNKTFYTLATIGIFVLASVVVYATVDKTTAWHPSAQIEPPTGCTANQYLKWTGTAWTCATVSSGGCPTGYAWVLEGTIANCRLTASQEVRCRCLMSGVIDCQMVAKYEDGAYYSRIESCYDNFNAFCSTGWSTSPEGCYTTSETTRGTVSFDITSRTLTGQGFGHQAYNPELNEYLACTCSAVL